MKLRVSVPLLPNTYSTRSKTPKLEERIPCDCPPLQKPVFCLHLEHMQEPATPGPGSSWNIGRALTWPLTWPLPCLLIWLQFIFKTQLRCSMQLPKAPPPPPQCPSGSLVLLGARFTLFVTTVFSQHRLWGWFRTQLGYEKPWVCVLDPPFLDGNHGPVNSFFISEMEAVTPDSQGSCED